MQKVADATVPSSASEARPLSAPLHFLWAVLGVLGLLIFFVNPTREMGFEDDWNYAVMVRHLLETGEYKLHQWLAPNLPFQTYWGGLFAFVFGYSFVSLRFATLVLVVIGLTAFYFLAREERLDDTQAGLISLVLLGSPMVVLFSFTFQTDIPFLMCLIIALAFYARAIRMRSHGLMCLASIAAAAAILTRQFGLAIPAGVFCVWLFGKEHAKQAPFFLLGLLLPAVAGVWQLSMGFVAPTKFQELELYQTSQYFADIGKMLLNTVFRPAIILEYLALFSLPLVFLAALSVGWEIMGKGQASGAQKPVSVKLLLLGMLSAYVVAGILYGRFINNQPWLMPFIIWDFEVIRDLNDSARVAVTAITSVGAVLYGYIFVLRYCNNLDFKSLLRQVSLLDWVTAFLLLEQLLFRKFGDRYLLVFLPYVCITVGQYLGLWLNRTRVVAGTACLVMLCASGLWSRGLFEKEESVWKGAQSLLSSGVAPAEIYGSHVWNCYHGMVDDYLTSLGASKMQSTQGFWNQWVPNRRKTARYMIVDSSVAPSGGSWKIVDDVPYRGMTLRKERMLVLERKVGGDPS
jgi:4-amino-4-deoxy-L-arabinose transferase-like glycosyltransferase